MTTEKEMYRLELEKRLTCIVRKMPDNELRDLLEHLHKAAESVEADENGEH